MWLYNRPKHVGKHWSIGSVFTRKQKWCLWGMLVLKSWKALEKWEM